MLIPLAHLGHLLVDIPLFAGPVILLVVALMWSMHRERGREHARSSGGSSA